MSNTYYTSLSGMLAASYGLQTTSNNFSNMQSSGFKRSDVFYSSLGNGNSDLLGSGVQVGGSLTNFADGKYLGTGKPCDVAIVGQGFFVIKVKANEFVYTRDGEFGFNEQGILVDKHSGGEVQGYDAAKNLVPIRQHGPKTVPGKASSSLYLKGQFILLEKPEEDLKDPSPFKNKYKNIEFNLDKVYDNQGKSHTIHLEFESTKVLVNGDSTKIPDDGKSWDLINVTYDDKRIDFKEQKIIFSSLDSGASIDNSTIQLSLNGGQNLSLHFGNYMDGSDKGVQLKEAKLNPEGTKMEVFQNDGYGLGKQLSLSFDDNGQIIYHYDNGKDVNGVYLGLARFDDLEHHLIPIQDSLFKAQNDCPIHLGRANEEGFGNIQAQQLESSNVDPTMEFANIVVLQRMFQACSQIMNIDKQLLEELESKS